MATAEVELRNYKRKNGLQPLVLRVTAGSVVSRKNTGLYIKEAEWDEHHKASGKPEAFALDATQ